MIRYNLGVTERTGVISRIWEWPDHPTLSDCEIEGFDGIVALHDIEEILAPKNAGFDGIVALHDIEEILAPKNAGFDGIVALHDIEEILAPKNAPDTPPCAAGSPGSPRPARPARLPS